MGESARLGLPAGLAESSASSSLSEKRKWLPTGKRSAHWNSAAEKRRLAYASAGAPSGTLEEASLRSSDRSRACCCSGAAPWNSS